MKKIIIILLCIVGVFSTSSKSQTPNKVTAETGTLLVLVKGFHSTEGQLMVALYNNSSDFLNKDPYMGKVEVISASEELIKFENVPYGDYAIAAIHDINKDGKLDKNMLGIPTEGYGFSNDAMDKFGPPTWIQASFVFAGRDEVKIIDLEYGIPD
jgi:uncharacterized protein (DUF2141 family)